MANSYQRLCEKARGANSHCSVPCPSGANSPQHCEQKWKHLDLKRLVRPKEPINGNRLSEPFRTVSLPFLVRGMGLSAGVQIFFISQPLSRRGFSLLCAALCGSAGYLLVLLVTRRNRVPQQTSPCAFQIFRCEGYDCAPQEISTEFSVTRERICQIEAKALKKLYYPVFAHQLKDYLD